MRLASTVLLTLAGSLAVATLLATPTAAIDCNKKPDHRQCQGGSGEGRDFRIRIDFDGAVTEAVFEEMTLTCTPDVCDLEGELSVDDLVMFRIPASYYNQWTLDEAEQCFGVGLDGSTPASAPLTRIKVRDHHGSPEHWRTNVDYLASLIDSEATKTHHANLQGDCSGPCPNLPPAAGTVNVYGDGYLTRTQVASRGRRAEGAPCTCAWDGCPPLDVEVEVEEVTP